MVLLQLLSCALKEIPNSDIFLCGDVTDKNLGLHVLVLVVLYLLLFIGRVILGCFIALMLVLLSFLISSATRWR